MPEKQRPKISRYDLVTGADTYATQTSQNPETSRLLVGWIPGDDGGLYREWNDPSLGTGLPSTEVKRVFEFDWIGLGGTPTRFFFAVVAATLGASTFKLYQLIGTTWTLVSAVGTLAHVPSNAKVQTGSLLHLSDGVTNWIFDGTSWLADGMQIPQGSVSLNVIGAWLPNTVYGTGTTPNYGLISDPNGNIQFSTTGGTSSTITPSWNITVGGVTKDGTVTWTNLGPPLSWTPSTAYPANSIIFNSNGTFMRVSAGGGGSSAATEPNWDERPSHTTADSGLTWFNHGKFVTFGQIGGIGGLQSGWIDFEWAAANSYALGNLIVDKNGNLQQARSMSGGGSLGTSGNTSPAWNQVIGGTTVDNTITWTNLGLIANLQPWQPNAIYTQYSVLIDSNGWVQVVASTGTSAATQPIWNMDLTSITTDGTIFWQGFGAASIGPPPMANIGKYYWYTNADENVPRVTESSSSKISLGSGPLNHQEVDVYPFPGTISWNSGSPIVTVTPLSAQLNPGPQKPILGAWMIGMTLFRNVALGVIIAVDPAGSTITLAANPATTNTSTSWYIADARLSHLHIYQSESDGSKIGQLSLITPYVRITNGPVFAFITPYKDCGGFVGSVNTPILSIFRPVRNDPTPPSLLAEVHKYRIWRRRESKPNYFNFSANEEVSSGLNGDPQQCVPGASVNTISDLVNEQPYPDASNSIRAFCSHGDALYIATEKQCVPLYGQSIDDFGLSQVTAFTMGAAGRFAMTSTAHGLCFVSYDRKVYLYPTSNYYWAYVPNDVNVTDNLIEIGKPLRKVLEKINPVYLDETQLVFYFFGRRNWAILSFRDNMNIYQTWVYDFTNKGWFKLAKGYSSIGVFEVSVGVKVLVGGSPTGGVYILDDLSGTYTSTGNQPNAVWRPALIDFGDPDSSHIPLYVEFEVSNPLMANDMTINYYLDPLDVDNPPTPRTVIFQLVQTGANKYRGYFKGGNLCQRLLLEFNAGSSPVSTNSGHIRGIKLVANPASGLLR